MAHLAGESQSATNREEQVAFALSKQNISEGCAQPTETHCLTRTWWNHICIINSSPFESVNNAVWKKAFGRICWWVEKYKRLSVQHHVFVTVTSFYLWCEGWAWWIIQLHDTCFTICILLPLAQVQCRFEQLEAVLHSQPLPIQSHPESLLLASYLWSHIEWGINQQLNAEAGVATWRKEVKRPIQT